MKRCSKCKTEKQFFCFSTNSKAKDGLHGWCRNCVNKARKENSEKYKETRRRYYRDNAEKINAKLRIYKSTEEFKRKKSKWDKEYREKNKEKISEKKSAYYSDRKHLRRQEYQRNKQRYIARVYERNYRIKCLTPPDADKSLIQEFYDESKRLTELTGIKHEVDHIIPISKGGLHHQDNLQILIWIENRKKGARILKIKEAA